MTKETVQGLLYYYENSADLDEGIRTQTVDVLRAVIAKMDEEAAILAKKRKSPNKSGVVQVDPETGKVVGEYASQKEALSVKILRNLAFLMLLMVEHLHTRLMDISGSSRMSLRRNISLDYI